MKYLTDMSFGRLTVIDIAGIDKFGHYLWSCLCDCGGQTVSASHNLLSGKTKSCGCIRKEEAARRGRNRAAPVLIGARYSELVVLENIGRDDADRVLVRCLCNCGRTTIARWGNVRSGITKSCGCRKVRVARERMTGLHKPSDHWWK